MKNLKFENMNLEDYSDEPFKHVMTMGEIVESEQPPATGFVCRICGKPAERIRGGWADCDHQQSTAMDDNPLCNPSFFARMKQELRDNQSKGDWNEWHPSLRELRKEIKHHAQKLDDLFHLALCKQCRKKEGAPNLQGGAADMANLCMKLYDPEYTGK
jgi:hypothetical protein